MPLAKGLLELHGGSIHAASRGIGHGAEFSFYLPCEEVLHVSEEQVIPLTPDQRRKLRVLVIEDNRDAADSLRLLLKFSGYDAHVAYTGTSGRDAALDHWRALLAAAAKGARRQAAALDRRLVKVSVDRTGSRG